MRQATPAQLAADGRQKFIVDANTKVLEFLTSNKPVDVIEGPLGSGKTKALCVRTMRHVQEQRKSPTDGLRYTRFAMVRNTMPDLIRSTIRTWFELFPERVYGRYIGGAVKEHHIRFDDVTCTVDFMSLDKEDDVRKLRSTEYTGICFNELNFMEKLLFDEARGRLRYPPPEHGGPTWRGVLADTNTPEEDDWLAIMTGRADMPEGLTELEQRQWQWPELWGYYIQPPALLEELDQNGLVERYVVNPKAENLKNLPPGYYDQMMVGQSKAWIDNRLLCRVVTVADGSPVWPQFRREFHVARDKLVPVPGHDVLVALDFGRVYPAALFSQEVNQRVLVQYEILGFNEPASVFAPRVKRFLEQNYPGHAYRCVGDPKGRDKGQQTEQSSYDIFRSFGMPVTPAPVPLNDIATRTEAVAFALNDNPSGVPRLLISPVCRTLIVGMAGKYHLVREDDGELRPKKDKYSNLCFVAGTMVSTPRGLRPIEIIRDGDEVSTPFGPRRVVATSQVERDTVELLLSNATRIRCTSDHPFWTDTGWVEAGRLDSHRLIMEGETGCSLPSKSGHASDTQSLSSWVSDIIGRATAIIRPCQTESFCTVLSGGTTMGQFRRATKFTTWTTIKQTTIQAILNAFSRPLIAACTCGAQSARLSLERTSKRPSSPLRQSEGPIRNGPQMSARRLEQQEQEAWHLSLCKNSPASSAAPIMRFANPFASAAFAQCLVKAWQDGRLALMTLSGLALNVARRLGQTNTIESNAVRVVVRELSQPALVYNITVDDVHCYYANGVLVSNCDALQYKLLSLGEGRRMLGLRPATEARPVQTNPRWRGREKSMRRVS